MDWRQTLQQRVNQVAINGLETNPAAVVNQVAITWYAFVSDPSCMYVCGSFRNFTSALLIGVDDIKDYKA